MVPCATQARAERRHQGRATSGRCCTSRVPACRSCLTWQRRRERKQGNRTFGASRAHSHVQPPDCGLVCKARALSAAPLVKSGWSWSSGTVPAPRRAVCLQDKGQRSQRQTQETDRISFVLRLSIPATGRDAFPSSPYGWRSAHPVRKRINGLSRLANTKDICRICPQTHGKPSKLDIVPKSASESDVRAHGLICKLRSQGWHLCGHPRALWVNADASCITCLVANG